MDKTSKYAAKKYRAPNHHEFLLIEAGLWRCKWCDGFVASERMPYREALALDEDKARELMTPNAKAVGLAGALSGQSHTSDGLCAGD